VNRRPFDPIRQSRLTDSQVFRGRLAPVFPLFVADLGAFIETAQTGFFHRRHVHENVFASAVGLDEPKSFDWIKPFHCACRHVALFIEAMAAA
jgi:hypothetical protein